MLQLDSQHLIDIEESMSRDPNVTDVRGDACKSRSHLEGLLGFLTGDAGGGAGKHLNSHCMDRSQGQQIR